MNHLGVILLSIGILGFCWTLFGSMFISFIFGSLKKLICSKKSIELKNEKPISFEILIAAFNEEVTIIPTLKSFEECLKVLKKNNSNMVVSAFVGLDHCTDQTLNRVLDFKKSAKLEVRYFENNGARGKWFILKQLIELSSADWVSLTDCGSIWNSDLLFRVESLLRKNDLICVAPSYLPVNARALETIYWRLEQFIRTIENLGGGSIMVHGLSVFYKREALIRAIALLGDTHWFNDDVAIPLTLRLDDPQNKIYYFADINQVAWVRDIGVVSDVRIELKRRKRILIGNLQIIKILILPRFKFFSLTSWISLRLVFKSFWAYWATCVGIGVMLILSSSSILSDFLAHQSFSKILVEILFLAAVVFMIRKSNYMQRLFMAYLSGLWIFKGWNALKEPEKISWS